MVGSIVVMCFKLLGALALFLYGMQLSSDGLQRAAGDRLQGTVNFMTKNRLMAVFSGAVVTVLLQSSSASTVMVVSFVNAGLLNLVQAIGVIMGANIGTTITGWIIAAVGIQKFSIALIAIPLFGVGFFMSLFKKKGESFVSYGEGLMGFALIFLGLEYLSKAIPEPSPDILLFLQDFSNRGWIAIILCVLVGVVFTMLISASSATIAIVIGLAAKGVLTFDMAAAITLGSNIGTTINSFLISLGSNTNAKRAAWAHILFNVFGTVWVVVVFYPFVRLVDFLTPGPITNESAGAHIAMLHTTFNIANTIVLLPFIKQYASFLTRLIKSKPGEDELAKLTYTPPLLLESPELNVAKVRADIAEMARVADLLYARLCSDIPRNDIWTDENLEYYAKYRAYSASMQEGVSRFLLEITQQDIAEKSRDNIGVLLRILADFDNVSESCCKMVDVQAKATRKKLFFAEDEVRLLEPYTRLVQEFLTFVRLRLGTPLSAVDLATATDFENRVDSSRAELKKLARKRIKAGSDVKAELQFLDLIRHIEKIGDYAYSIAENLREMK